MAAMPLDEGRYCSLRCGEASARATPPAKSTARATGPTTRATRPFAAACLCMPDSRSRSRARGGCTRALFPTRLIGSTAGGRRHEKVTQPCVTTWVEQGPEGRKGAVPAPWYTKDVVRIPALAALLLCPALALSLACSRSREATPAPAASASASSPGTLLLGERITSPVVPLADIAKDPARYANTTVATTGQVTAVCQEMGCWMELRDDAGQAHVRMHGHQFFVPKTAAGHVARVQATLVKGS